ncbi:hypothetical protein JCM3774_003234 [Rhodotorula dairenensis]
MHARPPQGAGGPASVRLPTPPHHQQQQPQSQQYAQQQYPSPYQQGHRNYDLGGAPSSAGQQLPHQYAALRDPPAGPPPPAAGGPGQRQPGLAPAGPSHPQPRSINGAGAGPSLPGQMIGPSHPSHPQHQAWVAHQQQLQLQAVSGGPSPASAPTRGDNNPVRAAGGMPDGRAAAPGQYSHHHHHPPQQQSSHTLGGPAPIRSPAGLPTSSPHLGHGGLPSASRMPSAAVAAAGGTANGTAPPYGSTFVQIPPSPIGASPRMPPGQVPPGGMHASIPLAPPQSQPQHGQIAPPARTIPSAAGMRPLSSMGGGSPHVNPNNGPGTTPSPFPQYLPAGSHSPAVGHPSLGHRQSISAGPSYGAPPPPSSSYHQPPLGPGPQHPGHQPAVRQSLAAQPNTLLAAHVAVNGTGPITATSAPSGPALSRLAALNEALQLALESDSPLEALRIAVADHFTDTGLVKIGLFDPTTPMSKVFEIPCWAFPRFQHINHLLGAISSSFQPALVREFRLTTPDPSIPGPASAAGAAFPVHIGYLLRSDDATWSSRFNDGARVDLRGSLTLHFMFKDLGNGAAGLRIESLEFDARGFDEYVPRSVLANLERALSAATADATAAQVALKAAEAASATASAPADESAIAPTKEEESEPVNGSRRRSSKTQGRGMNTRRRSAATKAELEADGSAARNADESSAPVRDTKPVAAASAAAAVEVKSHNGDSIEARRDRIAPSPVSSFGVTEMGMRCLEIAESVAQLQNLIAFSLESGFGPIDALSRYADMHRSGVFAPPSDRVPGTGGGMDGHGMYSGPSPVQQTFAAHPGLGGDIGGNRAVPEMVALKRAGPPPPDTPTSTRMDMLDRDFPSPQKMPRSAPSRGRGRGR